MQIQGGVEVRKVQGISAKKCGAWGASSGNQRVGLKKTYVQSQKKKL